MFSHAACLEMFTAGGWFLEPEAGVCVYDVENELYEICTVSSRMFELFL